jgi:hypothetical protein
MIPTRPIEEINEKRLRRCVQAYLGGEKNLNWIVGCIGVERALARELLEAFRAFNGTARYDELKAALAE